MDKAPPVDSLFPFRDRRKFPRQMFSIPVHFMGQEINSYLFSVDIGGGGIRLYSRKPLEPEKLYDFSLMIEAARRPIAVKGKVAWQRRTKVTDEIYEVGLLFQHVSLEHRAFLQDLLNDWKEMQKEERRQFLRVPRLIEATVVEEVQEIPFSGYVLDLSQDGVRFITPLLIGEKSAVSLKVEFEEGSSTTVNGHIAWGKRLEPVAEVVPGMVYVYGLKLEVASVELQAFINLYVNFQNRSIEAALAETLLSLEPGEK